MKKNLKDIRTLLIIVDMLNGFVREGQLADPYIARIIPEQLRLINMILKEEHGAIAFVKDCHKKGCAEFNRYPEHCIEGTHEAELVDELKPYESEALVYHKNSTCAIFAPGFIPDIDEMINLETIIGVGCESDICVSNLFIPLQNYFDEVNKNINIIIPWDAIETYDIPNHKREQYNDMAHMFLFQAGISLVKTYKGGNKNGKQKIN